jgi:hypothetical protein
MRRRFALPPLLLAALFVASVSQAQSPADIATARKLASEGIELYQAGKYAEALDKLDRAEKLYDAPVHLLYIARTQAKLDKLVEATETYRRLIRVKLDAGAPEAFRQAIEEAKKELPQIEPAIPSLRLEVTPESAAGLTLSIDGESVSAAVVGVERPINPGEHVIVAKADGFAQSEQRVTIARGEKQTLEIALSADGSAPKKAAAGEHDVKSQEQRRSDKKLGLFVGARLLGAIPAGDVGTLSAGAVSREVAMSDVMKGGGGLELHGGLRFARYFGGKLYLDLFSMQAGSDAEEGSQVSGLEGGLGVQAGTAPGHIGAFGELGVGFAQQFQFTDESVAGCVSDVTLRGGPSFRVGGGAIVPLGKYFQLTPFMVANFAQFSHVSAKASCEGGGPLDGTSLDQDIPSGDRAAHQLFLLGVGVDWLIGG